MESFFETAGKPVVPWSRWLAMFEDYLLAIDFPDGNEHVARKAALLRASLNVEGYRVYTTLVADVKESYEDAVVHLESHSSESLVRHFNELCAYIVC